MEEHEHGKETVKEKRGIVQLKVFNVLLHSGSMLECFLDSEVFRENTRSSSFSPKFSWPGLFICCQIWQNL